MLGINDTPTIRNAIQKRIGREAGVLIYDIKFEKAKYGDWYATDPNAEKPLIVMCETPFIRVGIEAYIGLPRTVRSYFDLPVPFEHSHLTRELDEIAEQYKAARLHISGRGGLITHPALQMRGSGMRGGWSSYG